MTTLVCHHLSIVGFHHFMAFIVPPKMKSPLCCFCRKWAARHLQKWIPWCKRFWVWNGTHLCWLHRLSIFRCCISFRFLGATSLFLVVCIIVLLLHCVLEVSIVFFLVMCAIVLLLHCASKISIACFGCACSNLVVSSCFKDFCYCYLFVSFHWTSFATPLCSMVQYYSHVYVSLRNFHGFNSIAFFLHHKCFCMHCNCCCIIDSFAS